MAQQHPIIVVGGGLAGSLVAVLLAERRPDIPVMLLESTESFGGNHLWSFFDSDISPETKSLAEALSPVLWTRHRVHFPGRERQLAMGYNSVSARALDALVRDRMPSNGWRLRAPVAHLAPDAVTLVSGERIDAGCVIDARGPGGPMRGLELGWQKFVGIEFAATSPDPDCPTVMDAAVPQIDGYRFVYILPLDRQRVLVEDTYYSNSADLDAALVADRVRALAAERGLLGEELREEQGVLPILIGGEPEAFWPADEPIARLGLGGGFFHPTTGYSFALALHMANQLSRLNGTLTTARLAAWSRAQFMRHWREGRYFRMLNRMLFHVAQPDQRHRVFSHFYRLPADTIARFYAAKLTTMDKLRIVSGRPPVEIGAAMRLLVGGKGVR